MHGNLNGQNITKRKKEPKYKASTLNNILNKLDILPYNLIVSKGNGGIGRARVMSANDVG